MTAVRVPGAKSVIAGHGPPAMPSCLASLTSRWAAAETPRGKLGIVLLAALHLAALGLLLWSEIGLVPKLVFCFTWGLLNFFWLAVLRRPIVSAALSLTIVVVLILLSRLKYEIIWMTANFLDVMIINADTISFLLAVKPELYGKILLAFALIFPALALIWWADMLRVRLRTAGIGFMGCAAALLGVSLAFPQEEWDTFVGEGYVSKFARSGEFRHITLAHERVPLLLGKGERDAEERGRASHESYPRGAQSHAQHVGPPDERQRRKYQCEREEDFAIKLRLHSQQKADRVGVDDHHVEEIRGHPDDLVFES